MKKMNRHCQTQLTKHHIAQSGFTLIELMVVVVIIAIFAAIAVPSYQTYMRRAHLAEAQQEMLKLAEQLERYKTRNFSYKGFDASYLYPTSQKFQTTKQQLILPLDQVTTKYKISIVDLAQVEASHPLLTADKAIGQGWAIRAESLDPINRSVLLTSTGIRCKSVLVSGYSDCGGGAEAW